MAPMNDEFQKHLTLALKASLLAGEAIRKVQGKDPRVEFKDDRTPLTQADKDAHRALASALTDLPLLSEEGVQRGFTERRGWGDFWLVDPLDGTKEFLQGNGEFTVNVALIRKGQPVLGVVFAPALGQLYFGAQGLGAFKTDRIPPAGEADTLTATSRSILARAPRPGPLEALVSRSHLSPAVKTYLDGLEQGASTVPLGSSLKFCRLAEGGADLYPRFGPTMEWDTAAGQAVLEAAGGRILDALSGTPLRYNKEDLHNPSFVAWGR